MRLTLAFHNPGTFDEPLVEMLNRAKLPATFHLSARDLLRPWAKFVFRGPFEIGTAGIEGSFSGNSATEFRGFVHQQMGKPLSAIEVELVWASWMIQGLFSQAPRTAGGIRNIDETGIALVERLFPYCASHVPGVRFVGDDTIQQFLDNPDASADTLVSLDVASLVASQGPKTLESLLSLASSLRRKGAQILTFDELVQIDSEQTQGKTKEKP